uniref:Amidohydrolase family protein n=1 Tax=Ganoderma boninense TaxID=34458 RepID=A0A5K1K369_9APHY|nr:Amidohydrolase family protein [Ganoderma boninense]
MAFGLTMGTERATALQNAIQDELMKRQYSSEPGAYPAPSRSLVMAHPVHLTQDPVMAEYITIMVINNKTAPQITSELEDLIGSEFDASFVDWLFAEAGKGAPEADVAAVPDPSTSPQAPVRDSPPHQALDHRRPPNGPRAAAPLYQQALSQVIPSTSPTAQKRTSSARSPSPSGHPPLKARRTDLPTGPRAMFRDRDGHGPNNSRSLLDRVGPRGGHGPQFKPHDDVQARIDSITNGGPPDPNLMMMNGGFPMNGMPGMDMTAMGMANPLMLQELMMNQMAMMSQIAGAMGIMNPATGQFMNNGFPIQPGMGDMNGFNNGMGGQMGHAAAPIPATSPPRPPVPPPSSSSAPSAPSAPTAITPSSSGGSVRPGFVAPERPQSPTLCKFNLKCTNPLCRYSHPSPVATAESGVVLSNDPCENGKDCKDRDCIKAHVSPAVLNPNAEVPKAQSFVASPAPVAQGAVPCRYGLACTRPNCSFSHPPRPSSHHSSVPCKFGAACTRSTCPYQHPEGRVLPTAFHRGLATTGGMINVPAPDTGSIGAPSHHKSVTFKRPDGTPTTAAELEKKVKEMEERKSEAQKAIAQAQAGQKGDASSTVPISA